MEPDFRALQLIAEISLGIVGFSAILIALSRSKDGFSAPDTFRIQLLTYSAFGAMFCALIPFAIFSETGSIGMSWFAVSGMLFLYSCIGLSIFPKRVLNLRKHGYRDLFPVQIISIQIGILSMNAILSAMIMFDIIQVNKNGIYLLCLMFFIVQSTIAFIRTVFVRVE
jgi:hypothetical protein|tara:strand:+ start:488 stop:991 length:504 start_codon:yes stop_codon:yes gene_type:complete